MSKVKIILEDGEAIEDVQEELAKAFINAHKDKKPKQFHDVAVRKVEKKLNESFEKMLKSMMADIEEEVKNGSK